MNIHKIINITGYEYTVKAKKESDRIRKSGKYQKNALKWLIEKNK